MKPWLLSSGILVIAALLFMGCSNSINNKITIKNMADGDIYFNFRGSVIDVASGQTTVISNIPKGTYNYSTTYIVPAGTTSSTSQGDLSGTFTLNAGTNIELLFSSILLNGTYTISVTISNSDSQSTSTKIGVSGQNEQKTSSSLTDP
jgi:hypothetical protein